MATAPQTFRGTGSPGPGRNPQDKQQLRRDRIVAAVVLVLFAVLMGLMIWLASLGGGEAIDYEYWMMP